MKALALIAAGGLECLRVQELPDPPLQSADEVLVQVRFAALNRLDLFVAEGLLGASYTFPHILGSDAAGIVLQLGTGARGIAVGDRVMVNPTLSCGTCAACEAGEESLCSRLRVLGEHCAGTLSEYIVVPARNLALAPVQMPWPEAAAFSLATLTAWRMLVTRARVEAGETVLIWGIGGGVAMAALQIARLRGARTIVTSGSNSKLARAKAVGADSLLNHSECDITAEVRRLTGGRGADVVVDTVGEQTWPASLRAVRRGGRVVTCGATSGPLVSLDIRRLFWHQWSLLGSTLGNRREYAEIVGLAHEGKLWPVVDKVVPLDRAISAYEQLQRSEQVGKLVIEVTQ
jgi:NADPH:quinone reductase-like Zn-dependent oxidoreductase